jgi:hypothetical protein
MRDLAAKLDDIDELLHALQRRLEGEEQLQRDRARAGCSRKPRSADCDSDALDH